MTHASLDAGTAVVLAKRATKRRSKWLLAMGIAALLAAVGASKYGYDWWTVGRFIETTDDAYVGGDATPISPHIAGYVESIPVADNQFVRAGQTLVRLDARDARVALDRAQAVLLEREEAAASLQAQYRLQQSAIGQAGADLDGRLAQAAFTQEDSVRYQRLAATDFGSKQKAQAALAADRQAQSAVVASQAALQAANERLIELNSDIAAAQAAVGQARADVDAARLDVGYADIRSPIDGYVGNRAAQVGAYVTPGAYLLTVVPAHGLWVDANFKEDQLRRVTTGQSATILADVAPGRVLHGRVMSLAPATGAVFSVIPPENATGNFTKIVQRVPVRIALDPEDAALGLIRPGLSITASVDTRTNGGDLR